MEINVFTKMKSITQLMLLVFAVLFSVNQAEAQVTSSSIGGVISNKKSGETLIGASVIAVHLPSGTRYGAITNEDGVFLMPSVRVGGPYKVTVTYVGYKEMSQDNVAAPLGATTDVKIQMSEDGAVLDEIVVTALKNDLINSKQTGAATTIGREAINSLPTIGRTVNDLTKYNAYSNGRSFAGQDARLNNFTIDGAAFNNGFGLGSDAQAGGRTGSSAISIDALEEVQINIAPFDVRQSGFAGAGINAVTRSGTNDFQGSVFGFAKNIGENYFLGKKIDTFTITQKPTKEQTYGFRFGGPIIKNKLFFFINGEQTKRTDAALTWSAKSAGATGNVSRVEADTLAQLSKFMQDNFGINLGPYDNFTNDSKSTKYLARIDWNINDNNKLALRYAHHDSESDAIISNSTSAGAGNRTNSANALSFENSGYIIQDNTRSIVGELNTNFSSKLANSFIVTFNKQIEDRKYRTQLIPTIDILRGGTTLTSAGFDPFTPSNKLNYTTFNITNNMTYFMGKHTIVAGGSFEAFKSNNLFFPASNGVYVFNSLQDFYTAARAYKANPNATTSPVVLNRFQYRYSALPSGEEPLQVLKVNKIGLYIQDEYRAAKNFKLTMGVRADVTTFGTTAFENTVISKLGFKDDEKKALTLNTAVLPKSRILLSPRIGFNWDVKGDQVTQLRGGTGLFVSSLPYVWISNQVGNNGVLSGFTSVAGTAANGYPFTINPADLKKYALPFNVNDSRLTFDINSTDPNFRFPQIWKTNLAVDRRLSGGLVATVEAILNKNIFSYRHINANLETPTGTFGGPDARQRFPGAGFTGAKKDSLNRINDNVVAAMYFKNTNIGSSYSFTVKLEKPISRNWGGMVGYTYGVARDLAQAGATANESWNNTFAVNSANYAEVSYANNDLRHRFVGFVNYRLNWAKDWMSTMFTLGCVSASGGKISYTYGGDMNGDGTTNNDLLFIPSGVGQIKFASLTAGGKTYDAAAQDAAFNTFIDGNEYLSSRRGQYAERNGGQFPWLSRLDFTVEHDFRIPVGEKRYIIRLRGDIFNVANMLNNNWGVGQTVSNFNPLTYDSVNAAGEPVYKINTQNINGQTVLLKDSFVKSINYGQVWQAQLGARLIF
jgi:hypothetical protein